MVRKTGRPHRSGEAYQVSRVGSRNCVEHASIPEGLLGRGSGAVGIELGIGGHEGLGVRDIGHFGVGRMIEGKGGGEGGR